MDQHKYEEQTMKSLSEASDGMFMWVRLMVDELSLQMSLANFEKTLQHPPKGLNGVYERVVFRINRFSSEMRSITIKMLQWIRCSMRPLRVDEMAEAVAIEFNAPSFDKSKRLLDGKKYIQSCCSSLIEIDNSDVICEHSLVAASPCIRVDFMC